MKLDDVPQDNSKTYSGHRKLLYARSRDSGYTPVQSSGWNIEEAATQDAVDYYEKLAAEAAKSVARGECSPLFYHMYKKRMDLALLAQTSGYFQWQIKRHFKPAVFAKLNDAKLLRYCEVLDLSLADIKLLPESL